jgi:hypothetical protein
MKMEPLLPQQQLEFVNMDENGIQRLKPGVDQRMDNPLLWKKEIKYWPFPQSFWGELYLSLE